MVIKVIAYTQRGGELGAQLKIGLQREGIICEGFLFEHHKQQDMTSFTDTDQLVREAFEQGQGLVFICATGIAVRKIAPYIQSKDIDSPVVVMDDGGQFAISLLSGHLGGANELAIQCARVCNAKPVITTATDVHKKVAIDVWAKKNELMIADIRKIKSVSSDILDGKEVPVFYDERYIQIDELPQGLIKGKQQNSKINRDNANVQITSSIMPIKSPFGCMSDNSLMLVPKQLVVGIGCKKETSYEQIRELLEDTFCKNQLNMNAIKKITSINLKKNEKGLIRLEKELKVPFQTFSSEELNSIPGEFTESEFVRQTTGVGSVCERSAMAGIELDQNELIHKGSLIVRKTAKDGVTIAVAIQHIQLSSVE